MLHVLGIAHRPELAPAAALGQDLREIVAGGHERGLTDLRLRRPRQARRQARTGSRRLPGSPRSRTAARRPRSAASSARRRPGPSRSGPVVARMLRHSLRDGPGVHQRPDQQMRHLAAVLATGCAVRRGQHHARPRLDRRERQRREREPPCSGASRRRTAASAPMRAAYGGRIVGPGARVDDAAVLNRRDRRPSRSGARRPPPARRRARRPPARPAAPTPGGSGTPPGSTDRP